MNDVTQARSKFWLTIDENEVQATLEREKKKFRLKHPLTKFVITDNQLTLEESIQYYQNATVPFLQSIPGVHITSLRMQDLHVVLRLQLINQEGPKIMFPINKLLGEYIDSVVEEVLLSLNERESKVILREEEITLNPKQIRTFLIKRH